MYTYFDDEMQYNGSLRDIKLELITSVNKDNTSFNNSMNVFKENKHEMM